MKTMLGLFPAAGLDCAKAGEAERTAPATAAAVLTGSNPFIEPPFAESRDLSRGPEHYGSFLDTRRQIALLSFTAIAVTT
jgi:hypothetical protein